MRLPLKHVFAQAAPTDSLLPPPESQACPACTDPAATAWPSWRRCERVAGARCTARTRRRAAHSAAGRSDYGCERSTAAVGCRGNPARWFCWSSSGRVALMASSNHQRSRFQIQRGDSRGARCGLTSSLSARYVRRRQPVKPLLPLRRELHPSSGRRCSHEQPAIL